MMGGAMMRPEREPTSRPPKVAVTALERWEPGTPLARTPVAAEGATPSPRPTRKRETRSAVKEKLGARGRVEGTKGPEHHASPEHELATVLGGEPATGNLGEGVTPEEGGLDETRSTEVQPKDSAMGTIATDMFTLSRLQSTKAQNRAKTMDQRFFWPPSTCRSGRPRGRCRQRRDHHHRR